MGHADSGLSWVSRPRGFTFSRMKAMVVSSGVPGPKMAETPLSFKLGLVFVGDGAAEDEEDVVGVLLVEQIDDAGDDDVVRAGEDGEADAVDVLLNGGGDDHLGGLAEAGVDDLHAGVAEGAGDDLGAAVVAVEAGLGYEDANGGTRLHGCEYTRSMDSLDCQA